MPELNQRTRHRLPHYFIHNLKALGWELVSKHSEGATGCFTRVHNDRTITLFARLELPRTNLPPEYRFTHNIAVGTPWLTTAHHSISGSNKTEYPRFASEPEKRFFLSPRYSTKFIKDASDYLLEWATNIDFREALLATADIPDGHQGYPRNSFSYITAHALLGNIDELENLKHLVADDLERPVVGYVKANHMDNAIECCNDPEKYGLSQTLINNLRGN